MKLIHKVKLATAALSVHCMPGKNARGSVRVFQFRLGSLFPRAHMGGLEQAIVFVFPLKHKFGTRAKIWRNTHLVWLSVFVKLKSNQIPGTQSEALPIVFLVQIFDFSLS